MTVGTTTTRRAAVQGEHRDRSGQIIRPVSKAIPPGSIDWDEHEKAWRGYARRYGNDQSAEDIHQRSGFGYWELCDYLGRKPKTWRPVHAGTVEPKREES